jgi:hypothetical protein
MQKTVVHAVVFTNKESCYVGFQGSQSAANPDQEARSSGTIPITLQLPFARSEHLTRIRHWSQGRKNHAPTNVCYINVQRSHDIIRPEARTVAKLHSSK